MVVSKYIVAVQRIIDFSSSHLTTPMVIPKKKTCFWKRQNFTNVKDDNFSSLEQIGGDKLFLLFC